MDAFGKEYHLRMLANSFSVLKFQMQAMMASLQENV